MYLYVAVWRGSVYNSADYFRGNDYDFVKRLIK